MVELPDCDTQWKGLLAGAGVAFLGVDTVLVPFGAPREVHWALAGFMLDAYCNGGPMKVNPYHAALCTAGGFVGGFIVTRFF